MNWAVFYAAAAGAALAYLLMLGAVTALKAIGQRKLLTRKSIKGHQVRVNAVGEPSLGDIYKDTAAAASSTGTQPGGVSYQLTDAAAPYPQTAAPQQPHHPQAAAQRQRIKRKERLKALLRQRNTLNKRKAE